MKICVPTLVVEELSKFLLKKLGVSFFDDVFLKMYA